MDAWFANREHGLRYARTKLSTEALGMRVLGAAVLFLVTGWVQAQTASGSASEAKAVRAFAAAAHNPLELRALLVRMPKGGDLHMHLSGAVYAETFLDDARADLMCVDPVAKSLATNVGTTRSLPPQPVCGEGKLRVDQAFSAQALYDALVDSFSMRSFVPSTGVSGHDQFFATFERFDPTNRAGSRHGGEWLDQIASRAAAQNEQYLEIMYTPDLGRAIKVANALSWPNEPKTTADFHQDVTGTSDAELAAARQSMLGDPAFLKAVDQDREEFAAMLADRREREYCGTAAQQPGCSVQVRFLFQVLRATSPSVAFAQTLLGFVIAQHAAESAGNESSVVGINFVQPEDNRVAMAEYTRQMRMIGYLHAMYPKVHIALHAGELAEGLVPPEGLRFHIRQAIDVAHAERIGHGVDVMQEDDANGLLRTMADRHVMVEINLTSNDVILGAAERYQPLPLYRAAGVPVALSTDDEGVSRIDLTHEYVRAADELHLNYLDLKRMARTSLEHSFLPGESFWRTRDVFTQPVSACGVRSNTEAGESKACAAFLKANPRAAEQWGLEKRFLAFEDSLP